MGQKLRTLPVDHNHPEAGESARRGACRPVSRQVGDRDSPGRMQDQTKGIRDYIAKQDTRVGQTRILRIYADVLHSSNANARSSAAGKRGPRQTFFQTHGAGNSTENSLVPDFSPGGAGLRFAKPSSTRYWKNVSSPDGIVKITGA